MDHEIKYSGNIYYLTELNENIEGLTDIEFENVINEENKKCIEYILSFDNLGMAILSYKEINIPKSILEKKKEINIPNIFSKEKKLEKETINEWEIEVVKKKIYFFKETNIDNKIKYNYVILEFKHYKISNYFDFVDIILFNKKSILINNKKNPKTNLEIYINYKGIRYSYHNKKVYEIKVEIDYKKDKIKLLKINEKTKDIESFNGLPNFEDIFDEDYYKTFDDMIKRIKLKNENFII